MRSVVFLILGACLALPAPGALASPPVCGDVNNSSSITTTDALLVLKRSVSPGVALDCSAYDKQFSSCETSLAGLNSDLSACGADLATTNADLSTCDGDLVTCDGSLGATLDNLDACNGNLRDCNGSLGSCNADLSACDASLAVCSSDISLQTCKGNLLTCTGSLGACGSNLATCNGNLNSCDSDLSACDNGLATCQDQLSTTNADLAKCKSGKSCGNGVVDGVDQCDGSNLGGKTCHSLGFGYGGTLSCTAGCALDTSGCSTEHNAATAQLTSYGAGDDGDLRPGTPQKFVDNGDGTVSDLNTGLMWEKKFGGSTTPVACTVELTPCTNPHNARNTYSWSASGSVYDGYVKTIFLNQLNNRCNNNPAVACATNADCRVPGGVCGFAGHRDWRLPSVKELIGILDYNKPFPGPVVAAPFYGANCGATCVDVTDPACSCDSGGVYETSTTYAGTPIREWTITTNSAGVNTTAKATFLAARAVR